MAQVKWQSRAKKELYRYLVKGFIEFGETMANNFSAKVADINRNLERFPEIGYPEPLLKDEGIESYIALIIQRSHPQFEEIITLFDTEIAMFQENK